MPAPGRDFSFAFLTRADQVVKGERYFPALRQAGLRYVSVGIESGSEASLERMVKQTGVEINRRALQILHDNDVAAQVEFIMFEPGSTLDDLHANLRFIEQQGLFGYFPPLIFGNLLLLPGTPAREQVEREQGLTGSIHETLPYDFEDPRVAEVFTVLGQFQRHLGDAWFRLAFELLMEFRLSISTIMSSTAMARTPSFAIRWGVISLSSSRSPNSPIPCCVRRCSWLLTITLSHLKRCCPGLKLSLRKSRCG